MGLNEVRPALCTYVEFVCMHVASCFLHGKNAQDAFRGLKTSYYCSFVSNVKIHLRTIRYISRVEDFFLNKKENNP